MKASSRCFQSFLSLATRIQVTPMNFLMSSSHLILGLACLRFRCSGNHSVTVRVHRSSFILATCPAHCHFSCFILIIMSCTPVCYVTHSFVLRSRLVIPIITLHASLSCFQSILHTLGYNPSLTPICHCSLYALIIHFCLQPYWYVTFH